MTVEGAGGDRLVLDCSAVMALFVEEPYTSQAEQVVLDAMRRRAELLVLDLTFVECANVMWKYFRKGGCQADKAAAVMRSVADLPLTSVPTRALFEEALAEAVKLGISAYDAAHVVLAKRTGAPLITGDRRLRRPDIGARFLGDL